MKPWLIVIGLLVPTVAHAEDALSVTTDTDHVEIVVRGAETRASAAASTYDFIEIPVTGTLAPSTYIDGEDGDDDPTLKRIQVRDGSVRIQLHHSQETTARIAAATRLLVAADGLHIRIPRKQALATWATTNPVAPAIIEGPAAPAPPPPPAPVAAPVATATAPTPLPASVTGRSEAPAAAAPTTTKSAPAMTIAGGSPASPPTSSVALVVGILAAGGALVVWARRRKPAATTEAINVIASRSLGGKARVVLLAAGDRELLLSVSDRGAARLIGRWRRADTSSALVTEPLVTEPGDDDDLAAMSAGPRGSSPSVAGILKLKLRGKRESAAHQAAGLEADADWARALTGARAATGSEEHDA